MLPNHQFTRKSVKQLQFAGGSNQILKSADTHGILQGSSAQAIIAIDTPCVKKFGTSTMTANGRHDLPERLQNLSLIGDDDTKPLDDAAGELAGSAKDGGIDQRIRRARLE